MGRTELLLIRRKWFYEFLSPLKIASSSAGYKPANLGSNYKHTTIRPPRATICCQLRVCVQCGFISRNYHTRSFFFVLPLHPCLLRTQPISNHKHLKRPQNVDIYQSYTVWRSSLLFLYHPSLSSYLHSPNIIFGTSFSVFNKSSPYTATRVQDSHPYGKRDKLQTCLHF
jgi:hypothetical protein